MAADGDGVAQRLDGSTVERLAQAIHAGFLAKRRAAGEVAIPSAVGWDALGEEFRESNRARARAMVGMLHGAGFVCGLARDVGDASCASVEEFDDPTTALLAHRVHSDWMRERLAAGWVFAPVRDDERRHHPCLVPYDDLPASEQQKDIDVVRGMIPLLKSVGVRVYRKTRASHKRKRTGHGEKSAVPSV